MVCYFTERHATSCAGGRLCDILFPMIVQTTKDGVPTWAAESSQELANIAAQLGRVKARKEPAVRVTKGLWKALPVFGYFPKGEELAKIRATEK